MCDIVSYDIMQDTRQNKITKNLLDYGVHVQYSVFECHMKAALFDELTHRLMNLIDTEESLHICNICRACEKTITILGHGEILQDKVVHIL